MSAAAIARSAVQVQGDYFRGARLAAGMTGREILTVHQAALRFVRFSARSSTALCSAACSGDTGAISRSIGQP